MKTLLYPAYERLEVTNQPDPRPGHGEVLLKVAACGICGSELEAFRNRSPRRVPPLILGHEFCGVIAETGPGVTGFATGQRVVSNSLFPCGQCARCRRGDTHLCAHRQIFGMQRPGAFAEYVSVPSRCLIPWPEQVPAEAACLAEPLANGVHVVHRTEPLNPKRVVVIGAGPIGLMCQQAFQSMRHVGVLVSDLIPERLDAAKKLGAKRVINSREEDFVQTVLELTDGEGADLVVDAVGGHTTKKQSLLAARAGGAAVWIGLHENSITLDSYDITLQERQVLGSYAATLGELKEALDLMASGKIETASWVKTFPLGQGVDAFQRMLAAKGDDIKAVLLP